jgi:hypothetical protein
MPAKPACAICTTNPGHADTSSDGQLGCAAFHNVANNLMAGNQLRAARRQLALDDVQVRAADSAGPDPQQHLSSVGIRAQNLF